MLFKQGGSYLSWGGVTPPQLKPRHMNNSSVPITIRAICYGTSLLYQIILCGIDIKCPQDITCVSHIHIPDAAIQVPTTVLCHQVSILRCVAQYNLQHTQKSTSDSQNSLQTNPNNIQCIRNAAQYWITSYYYPLQWCLWAPTCHILKIKVDLHRVITS